MLKTRNQKASVVLMVIGIIFLVMSFKLPTYALVPVDADAVPIFLGCLLIFLSIILFFMKDQETELPEDALAEESEHPDIDATQKKFIKNDTKMLLLFGALILIYIFLLELLGFLLVTAIFIFISTRILGYKRHVINLIVALAIPIFFYYLFNFVLQISLPKGILPF